MVNCTVLEAKCSNGLNHQCMHRESLAAIGNVPYARGGEVSKKKKREREGEILVLSGYLQVSSFLQANTSHR
jgi:hypothetical protein